ncbi:MAG: NAD(P)H-hydrate dehydratase [Rhizobiales bacterium]|nr:NAD(P)H-hydrate dehydratase [Hyphomicrobiales bacterium]
MGEADRRTIAAGTRSNLLMERAGEAVAAEANRMVAPGSRIAVLCGPGNNGGDGFVAARVLAAGGHRVSVHLLGKREQLKGDASLAARAWPGPVEMARRDMPEGLDLIIDAIFGAGLDRPIEGEAGSVIDGANESGVPILAVDLPSGIDGATGAILGRTIIAKETVTFFRRKPGHLLMPGRRICGPVTVAEIGMDPACLLAIKPKTSHNLPALWHAELPQPHVDGHKYDRGHAVVVSGHMSHTGAARLSARGALRIGAGLVTVASPEDALAVNAAHLTSIMLRQVDGGEELSDMLADRRLNAVVLGPGLGVEEETTELVAAALSSGAAAVLDADALTSYAGAADPLFLLIRSRKPPVVLTPHDGEFARLFPDLAGHPSKLERAREAARRSGALVVLKGPDTVVATPDGRASIADNAPPYLATAGSGDVLAGMIGGLLAQRMPAFEAASAAVWLHGAAGARGGRGLISEDLPELVPAVFGELAAYAR